MEVNPLGGAFEAQRNGSAQQGDAASKASLEKESFLKLLVAQISNQDPMNPQDSDKFTEQLTQFGVLEQLMNVNDGIGTLAVGQLGISSQEAVQFVGKQIVANGDHFDHDPSVPSTLDYDIEGEAERVTVTVLDENGTVVKSEEMFGPAARTGQYTWYGENNDGGPMKGGRYRYAVTAEDAEGNPLPTRTNMTGRVTGVRFDNGYPELMVGDRRFRMSDVREVVE